MEKFKLLLKMLSYNKNNYKMYLYCNIFAVALFTAFLSVYHNESFMSNYKIDSSISSNVFAPTILMGLFMVSFLPYAYTTFLKGRKQEYAVFMVLGMTESEVLVNMFLECLIVSAAGAGIGLVAGSVLSFIFFIVLRDRIGLQSVQWEYHVQAYEITVILYVCVVVIILFIHSIQFLKTEILDLFKARFKEENRKRGSGVRLMLGVGILFLGIFCMLAGYDFHRTYIWFLSIGISMAGMMFIIFNFDFVIKRCAKREWKISISFVLQNMKSWRIAVFISAFLCWMLIFFLGHCMVTYPNFTNNAVTYSPYDLFYVKYPGINQMDVGQIEDILNKNGIALTGLEEVEILRSGACNIINAREISEKTGHSYQVEAGKFIQLFQADLNDGYEHDIRPMQTLLFDLKGNQKMQLRLKESSVRVLFNSCNSLSDITLILNDKDFEKIKRFSQEYFTEYAVMIRFDHWINSAPAIEELQAMMEKSNGLLQEDQNLYHLSSKVEKYTIAKQSAGVLNFFMFFVAIVFWGAANATIYFKIKSELNEEKRQVYKLFRIGILETEIRNIILKKNVFYYFISFLTGGSMGVFYSFCVNEIYRYGKTGLLYGGLVTAILFIVQLLVFWFVSKKEYQEVAGFS